MQNNHSQRNNGKNRAVPNWENPDIQGINKLDAHCISPVYSSYKDAVEMRSSPNHYSLNGEWDFYFGNGDVLPADYSNLKWSSINVPIVWQLQGYGTPYYYANSYPQAINTKRLQISRELQEYGIYRRSFEAKHFNGNNVYIHFGGAKASLELYINEKFVGYSQCSNTPHEFNITEYLHEGLNQIVVVVWRYSDGTYLEDQDMWFFSGLYRDVYLFAEPTASVWDFYFSADLDEQYNNATAKLSVFTCGKVNSQSIVASIAELGITLNKTGENGNRIDFSAHVPSPNKWSHEQPNLYTLLIEWRVDGVSYYKSCKIGFKKVEIKGNVLHLNGKRLIVRGVNRHDFHPKTGWTLCEEQYHQDLRILKSLNINAIRTSHYPNNPLLYRLCDQYGILVMDEADLESHGARRRLPKSNPMWLKGCLERAERMVLRDRNHACVFFWSLGNEAGTGDTFLRMRQAIERLDQTRPFHYEGEHSRATDVISRMYPFERDFIKMCNKQAVKTSRNPAIRFAMNDKEIGEDLYATMPVMLCEYAHCMGNSLGNFSEFTDAFERYPHMCGGFIWDFVDQSIFVGEEGKEKWLYGDDFAEQFSKHGYKNRLTVGSSGAFCANGIVSANRQLHPTAYEVKKCYQTVQVELVNAESLAFKIVNKQMFLNLTAYKLVWQVECKGKKVHSNEVSQHIFSQLEPQCSVEFCLPKLDLPAEGEITISFSWLLKNNELWQNAGYMQAFDQFVLRPSVHSMPSVVASLVSTQQNGKELVVFIGNCQYTFKNGILIALKKADQHLLQSAVMPNLYRALIDNDYEVANQVPQLKRFVRAWRWRLAQEKMRVKGFSFDPTNATLTTVFRHSLCKRLVTQYTFLPNGEVALRMEMIPKISAMRLGVSLALGREFDCVDWYGREHESYPDRKSGSKISAYTSSVSELEHRYMRPQENGTRCDVQRLSLSSPSHCFNVQDLSGKGMLFSSWHYTQEALLQATHWHSFATQPITTLNLDGVMCGVGGDLPGFTVLHNSYKLHKGTLYSVNLLIGVEQK